MALTLPEDLVTREITAICQQYRIAPAEARILFAQFLQRRPDLLKKIPATTPAAELTRLRSYHTLIKQARKQIYYHLRQYQADKPHIAELRAELGHLLAAAPDTAAIDRVRQALLLTHVSTQERAPDYPLFYQKLFEVLAPPRTILDLGCGLHPLSYPFTGPTSRPELYVAVDQQPDVIATLTVFAPYVRPTRLLPVCADIAETNWQHAFDLEISVFDVAFLLKLIPVIARQARHVLPRLAAAPARQLVITAASEAMTRKTSIRRREDRVLREFIALTGRPVLAAFDISTEFGYLLGEPTSTSTSTISKSCAWQ